MAKQVKEKYRKKKKGYRVGSPADTKMPEKGDKRYQLIVQAASEGMPNYAIAEMMKVGRTTFFKWLDNSPTLRDDMRGEYNLNAMNSLHEIRMKDPESWVMRTTRNNSYRHGDKVTFEDAVKEVAPLLQYIREEMNNGNGIQQPQGDIQRTDDEDDG